MSQTRWIEDFPAHQARIDLCSLCGSLVGPFTTKEGVNMRAVHESVCSGLTDYTAIAAARSAALREVADAIRPMTERRDRGQFWIEGAKAALAAVERLMEKP